MVMVMYDWILLQMTNLYTNVKGSRQQKRSIKDFVLVSSRTCKINSLKQGTAKLINVVSPLYKNCLLLYRSNKQK